MAQMVQFCEKPLDLKMDKIESLLSKYIIPSQPRPTQTPTQLNIMSGNAEILKLLKALSKDMAEMKLAVKELQEDNASSAVNAEKMYKILNAKFDMFKNLETQSREQVQPAASTRKPTRPAFFKQLFLDDRDKHLNVLYTQEEIDAAFQEKEVLAKKKEADRISKVVTILYTRHIKANSPEGRASAFASIYEQTFAK